MFRRIAISLALATAFLAAVASCQPASDPVDYEATVVPKSSVADSDDGFTYVTVTAKGEWSIELQYPSEGPRDWAVMDPASGNGNKTDARIRYSQNEEDASRTVTLVLLSGGKQVNSAIFTQNGQTPQPSTPDGYDTTTAGWLELPETKAGDGCVFLPHDMEGKKYLNKTQSGVRNWSCYWCYDEHLSQWVAYPLNTSLAGNQKFDYLWGFDPLLPSSMQPNITQHSYGGYGFDGKKWNRGHQLPRADRQVTQKSVASTCYPTNMTPQDGSFNSGIWVNLENAVRNFAGRSDTLYVVTGCMWNESKKYTQPYSDTQFAVKVPNAYFKALLFRSIYNPSGKYYIYADETKGFMAVAYYIPHDTSISGKPYNDYQITVDRLEEITGIDFFVNLPGQIGEDLARKVESEVASFWK